MSTHAYQVSLTWKDGRTGELSSPELTNKLEVATPPNFANGVEGIWSPEHLYTAAASSCLMTTFLAIAENFKLEFDSFNCEAKGVLDMVEGKYLMTEVHLKPIVGIRKAEDKEKALRVLEKSEKACLISNSIKAKVNMTPEVFVAVTKELTH